MITVAIIIDPIGLNGICVQMGYMIKAIGLINMISAVGLTIPTRIAVDVENKVNITNKVELLHKKYVSVLFLHY